MVQEFERIIEATPDPLIACDGSERIRYVNAAAEHLLGWKRAELEGHPFLVVLPARLKRAKGSGFVHYLFDRMSSLRGRPIRIAALERDGGEVVVDCTVGRSTWSGGESFVVFFRRLPEAVDFTDEPLEQLVEAPPLAQGSPQRPDVQRFYQLVFESAPIGLLHFNHEGIITACNDYLVKALGSSKQRMIGLNLLTLKDERLMACVGEALRGHSSAYDGEYISLTGDKAPVLHVQFAPCRDGGVGIVEDISERKAQEREQSRTNALLELLFRTAPLGVAVFDNDLRYVHINDQMAEILGPAPTAHLGRSVLELVPPIMAADAKRFLNGVLETGQPALHTILQGERFREALSGRWFEFNVYPVRTAEGERLGLGVLCEDITLRKQLEEETARLVQDSQDAIRVRDDFLSIASHELKTPLTPLFLRISALERQLERGEAVDVHHLKTARAHLLRLTSLINDLLDVSRIESGRLSLQREPVELNALLARVTEDFAGRSKHTLLFEPSELPRWVLADLHRLEQVLVNLVDNAIKYSPDGGTVRIRIRTLGSRALIMIRDQGIGIPKEEQTRLFERYFRARNASTRSFGGLGLGLYIARDIVEHHGGHIWVESEVGRGSTFFISLPLHATVAPEHHENATTH